VNGLLVDADLQGVRLVLLGLFEQPERADLWNSLACMMPTFDDIGLDHASPDLVVWQTCQNNRLVLFTANRNARGKDSLEWAIRTFNQPNSLPVITLGTAFRFQTEPDYRHQVADKVLEYLFEIDNHRGVGRLWVP
jgi:hypothetical protein